MSKHTPYWFNVIRRAVTRGNKGLAAFTLKHRAEAYDFVTCACGKQDPRIPRYGEGDLYETGTPKDKQLKYLGRDFATDVCYNRPYNAMRTLFKIEQRSAEILKGLTTQQKGNGDE